MQKKALLAFDDPGGGLAVSSLIDSLKQSGFDVKIHAGKLSRNIAGESEFEHLNSNISKAEAEQILFENSPDILITGTSAGNAEQELRNAAHKKNISSVVVMDFWKDYSRRWLYADYPITELKDSVCVMDELTKKEMMEEKFPEEKLIVTGHPYLDKIFNFKNEVVKVLHVQKNNFLFLSQPFSIIGITDYDEHPFRTLLEALKKYASVKNERISLTVKLHPSEIQSEELKDLICEYNSQILKVEFSGNDIGIKELLEESELVFGYNTIAMFESRALNKRTISLNVVPVRNSLERAMRSVGIEIVKASTEDLFECIMRKGTKEAPEEIFRNGINNCVNVILNEITVN